MDYSLQTLFSRMPAGYITVRSFGLDGTLRTLDVSVDDLSSGINQLEEWSPTGVNYHSWAVYDGPPGEHERDDQIVGYPGLLLEFEVEEGHASYDLSDHLLPADFDTVLELLADVGFPTPSFVTRCENRYQTQFVLDHPLLCRTDEERADALEVLRRAHGSVFAIMELAGLDQESVLLAKLCRYPGMLCHEYKPSQIGEGDGPAAGPRLTLERLVEIGKGPFYRGTSTYLGKTMFSRELCDDTAGANGVHHELFTEGVFTADASNLEHEFHLRSRVAFDPYDDKPDGEWRLRRLVGMDYIPGENLVTIVDGLPRYNLWRPAGVHPVAGNWGAVAQHLERLLPRRADRDFVLDILASAIQTPARKVPQLIALRSGDPAEKQVFAQLLKRMFDHHYTEIAHHSLADDVFSVRDVSNRQVLIINDCELEDDQSAILERLIHHEIIEADEDSFMRFAGRTPRIIFAARECWTAGDQPSEFRPGVLDQAPAFVQYLSQRDITGFDPTEPSAVRATNELTS